MPEEHALLSASGSALWLHCAAGVLRSKGIKDETSAYAEEGRRAHEQAEFMIRKRIAEEVGETFKGTDPYPEFAGDVEPYVLHCVILTSFAEWVGIEQRLDFSQWVPEGFGTGDFVSIVEIPKVEDEYEIVVVDLKFGKGVKVFADTPQLRLYALGALAAHQWDYHITRVRCVIHQPRLDHVDEYTISVDELLDWAENTVKPAASRALVPNAPATPGDKQCRWCRVKTTCRERALDVLAKAESHHPLDPTTIATLLPVAEELGKWAKDLQEYALKIAVDGSTIPGHKLVEGRVNRQWTAEAAEILMDYLPEEQVYSPRKLIGLTEAQKLLGGKKAAAPVLDAATVSRAGKPTLVPESDPRPPMSQTSANQFPIYED